MQKMSNWEITSEIAIDRELLYKCGLKAQVWQVSRGWKRVGNPYFLLAITPEFVKKIDNSDCD